MIHCVLKVHHVHFVSCSHKGVIPDLQFLVPLNCQAFTHWEGNRPLVHLFPSKQVLSWFCLWVVHREVLVQPEYRHDPEERTEWWFIQPRVGLGAIFEVELGLDNLQSYLPKKIPVIVCSRVPLCSPMASQWCSILKTCVIFTLTSSLLLFIQSSLTGTLYKIKIMFFFSIN